MVDPVGLTKTNTQAYSYTTLSIIIYFIFSLVSL